MITTSKIEMDLNWYSQPKVEALQDDQYSRDVQITLLSDGAPWAVPNGATVIVNYIKPDGLGGEYDTMPNGDTAWSASGNVLTVKLAPQVLTVAGAVYMGITMVLDHKAITTFRILINVRRNVAAMLTASESYKNVVGFVPMPSGAVVGQYIKVTEVDSDGRVRSTKTMDLDAPLASIRTSLFAKGDNIYKDEETGLLYLRSGTTKLGKGIAFSGGSMSATGVTSVNGKKGAVTLDAASVGADPANTAATLVAGHNTAEDAHNDLRLMVQQLQNAVNAFMDVDDTTRDSLSEVLALIDENADVIDTIITGKVNVADIIDNLSTNVSNKPLSAAQGVALKALFDSIPSWAMQTSKPSYGASEVGADPANTAATLVAGHNTAEDAHPKLLELINQLSSEIGNATGTISNGSVTPEKTNFIVCEGTGETESTLVPNFTNLADPTSSDWNTDTRFSTSKGTMSECVGAIVTNTVYPVYAGDTVCIKGIKGGSGDTASAYFQIVGYTDEAGTAKCSSSGLFVEKTRTQSGNGIKEIVTVEDGVTTWTAYTYANPDDGTAIQSVGFNGAVALRIGGVPVGSVDDIIITVNEPITYTEVTSGGKSYTLDEKIIVPRANGLKSGARWFALGDSITQGWASAVDSTASSGYRQFLNTNESERWVNIVAEKNGYILTNYGVGGTGYAHHTSGNVNARAQVANIDFSQCDMVTLAFGVNDWKGKATLGSMDDDVDTVDAFVPNMRYVIKKILSDNPYCKIFVITPFNCRSLGDYARNWGIGYDNAEHASGPGLEQIYQMEKTVCEFHGIELIDMTHCSIINRENIRTMLADYVHPTVECHAVLGRELARKIKFA